MNQQIKLFAEQSKQSVPQGILGVDAWIEMYNKKFAELVIEDVLSIVNTAGAECAATTYDQEVVDCIRQKIAKEINNRYGAT